MHSFTLNLIISLTKLYDNISFLKKLNFLKYKINTDFKTLHENTTKYTIMCYIKSI